MKQLSRCAAPMNWASGITLYYTTIYCTKSVRQTFFACGIVNIWNFLPDTVCFSSQAGFSQSIEDIDLSAYLRCY